TLPLYQKKCTLLDALCQAIESYWSIHANGESRQYSQKSIRMILENMDGYLSGSKACAKNMILAANYAGRAICISQTTAAHAMSYKLTSLYKIPHGRAAFLCLPYVWEYMIGAAKENAALDKQFCEIAVLLNCETPAEAVRFLKRTNRELFQDDKVTVNREDIPLLAGSVNAARLKNNPVVLDENTLTLLYTKILEDCTLSSAER
ncbi:MAG: iron-containing alcohol dehydrogenase, partial [Faecousia sp.]